MAGKSVEETQYKILMIAPTSFFSDYGCSVRILEEAKVLRRLGNQITLCTYRNGRDIDGLTIHRTPSIPFREHYEVGSSPHKIAFDLLLFWTVLFTALRQHPDVIHAHMHEGALIGLLVGRLLGIPVLFDFQGSLTSEMVDHGFLEQGSVFYRPLRWLETIVDRRASVVLTSSQNAKQFLVDDFGCQPEKVLPVPDCVDAENFYPRSDDEKAALSQRRIELGIPPGRQVVVYLGLLADYQGTDALLQAAAFVVKQRQDAHFLIMGFPAVEHYRHMAQRLGVTEHTTFTGKIPYTQARSFLALGDIAVAPKLSATEGSGKILNYMAMGLPTIAFETPVSKEYLAADGIYATPGDAQALADAILVGLAATTDKRLEVGRRLRQKAAASFSWDQAAQTILRAYRLVCHVESTVI